MKDAFRYHKNTNKKVKVKHSGDSASENDEEDFLDDPQPVDLSVSWPLYEHLRFLDGKPRAR
jgi:hypothetical protein